MRRATASLPAAWTTAALLGTALAGALLFHAACGDSSGIPAAASDDAGDGTGPDALASDGPADVAAPDGGDAAGCPGVAGGGFSQADWAQWPMPNSPLDVAAGAPHPASYVDDGDGTVTDQVTGLMWQQAPPPAPIPWTNALSYCASSTLGGHDDWRAPTYIELVSLVDYARQSPSIDPTAFPGAPPTDFWTSTPVATAACNAWEIYFSAGDSSFDPTSGVGNSIRCVRTATAPAHLLVPPARYAIGSGTVTDLQTGLVWQQPVAAGPLAQSAAASACAALGDGGPGSWRLPTVKELLTLVDVTRPTPPTIDPTAFPGAPAAQAWSSTPVAGQSGPIWAVQFDVGFALQVDASTALAVRCVR
jgi:hypothetical protein